MSDSSLTENRVDPLAVFPEEHRLAVSGLTQLGYIEAETEYCGHTFRVRTLRPAEKAAIALMIKPWQGTLGEPEVWANGHVALALSAIDGNANYCDASGPSLNDLLETRYKFLTNSKSGFFQSTLTHIFEFWLGLEAKSLDALQSFQNLAPRSQQPSSPSADSFIEQDSSPNVTDLGIPLSAPSNLNS